MPTKIMTVKIEIDQETYERLVHRAITQTRRATAAEAGIVLRKALGLPFDEPEVVVVEEG